MKKLIACLSLLLTVLAAAACTATTVPAERTAQPTAVTAIATPTLNPTATETPPKDLPPTVPVVSLSDPTAVPDTADLLAIVTGESPQNAYEAIKVMSLYVSESQPPLWAVFSQGFRNFELDPVPGHFIGMYTFENGRWLSLARLDLNSTGEPGYGPDYLFEQSVTQVDLDPAYLWLAVDGGAGAHGGTFQLLRFDDTALHLEIDTGNASPGVGYLEDVNGDVQPELILRHHDYYVFCYACGVRYLIFGVHSWENASQQLVEHRLQPLPQAQQGHPAYQPANRAVALANAGLWQEALVQIEAAEQLANESTGPIDSTILEWNAALIRLYNQAWQAELNHSPFPLLTNIFYGDYAAALDLMGGYTPEQLFSPASPVVQGTVAEGNEMWLANYILQQANAAISVQPDLAAPYFFRAWARSLLNPADAQIGLDLAQAAALEPQEPLFTQSVPPAANRILFAPGATSAAVTGQLPPQSADVYVLAAQAGQQMSVVLSVPGDDARITVRDSQGDYLPGQMTSTVWQGQLPASGDYVIRIFSEETAVSYSLQIIIPERINFAPGAISATLDGAVKAAESHDYILSAQAGQTMDVVIQSPNNNVLLTIVSADGIPLTNGLMSGATSWRGELLASQDYTIRAIGTVEDAAYVLTVTIE